MILTQRLTGIARTCYDNIGSQHVRLNSDLLLEDGTPIKKGSIALVEAWKITTEDGSTFVDFRLKYQDGTVVYHSDLELRIDFELVDPCWGMSVDLSLCPFMTVSNLVPFGETRNNNWRRL